MEVTGTDGALRAGADASHLVAAAPSAGVDGGPWRLADTGAASGPDDGRPEALETSAGPEALGIGAGPEALETSAGPEALGTSAGRPEAPGTSAGPETPGTSPGAEAAETSAGAEAAETSAGPEAAETSAGRPPLPGCRARAILDRVGDKWSVFVIDRLGQGSQRFSELRRGIDGITGRMLTVTLRGLERDGLVSRTIHPVIPPRVDYELTPMGRTLLKTIEQLIDWADSHVSDIHAAQTAYDVKHAQDAADAPSAGDPEIAACEAAESTGGAAEPACQAAEPA